MQQLIHFGSATAMLQARKLAFPVQPRPLLARLSDREP